jgi:CheY-like chemotaxis protein
MLLKGKRIFITEDNVTNRSVMQLLLEREGATVAFERWGLETCDRLKNFAPVDIILLDLMLPDGISGLNVFDEIRGLSDFKDIPIIAVSAKEPDIAIAETQAKGFDGFIGKPINRMHFARQIADVINGEHIWEAI